MARKKHHEEGGAGEGWLVSYCDMISLLVTFFLMMMTFSTNSTSDIKAVGVGLLKGRGGIFPNLSGYQPPQTPDPTMLKKLAADLNELRSARSEHDQVGLDANLDGLAILFGSDASFDEGSKTVGAKLRDDLTQLARKLARYDQLVVVEGHVDSREAESNDPELAVERALAATAVLAKSGLSREQIQIAAQGSQLRAVEDSDLGRKLNRCVEIHVLSVTRNAAAEQAQETR